jgi:serine/threonine protein kinase
MVDPLVGKLVSPRYRIIGLLGSGETGTVWDGRDELLDLSVAIKVLRQPEAASDQQRAELLHQAKSEARHTGQLAHPSIVAVYDVVSEFDRTWVIMQRVAGRSLAAEIAAGGVWDASRAARLGLQLIEALDAAHASGVVHGAVKPSNVLIPEFGAVLLTDFSLTPSQEEADLLGLGATLYFAVEGQLPLAVEPLPPRNAGPIAEVIEGLLAADPVQRLTLTQAREQLTAALPAPTAMQKKAKQPLDIST